MTFSIILEKNKKYIYWVSVRSYDSIMGSILNVKISVFVYYLLKLWWIFKVDNREVLKVFIIIIDVYCINIIYY